MITRPVMRYPGGKYLMAKWVVSHFPAHRTFVDLYGGGGSILMRKPRSFGEVYNDIDDDVVNVFKVLRDPMQVDELARLLRLTPMAYREYKCAYETCDEPIERARRTIFRSFAGIGSDSVNRNNAGFRGLKNGRGMTAGPEWATYPESLKAFISRLQGVIIESRDAMRLIDIYDQEETCGGKPGWDGDMGG